MRWAMGLAVALLVSGGCTEEKGDCRWAAETLCEDMLKSSSDAEVERLYDVCVARAIMNCGPSGDAR